MATNSMLPSCHIAATRQTYSQAFPFSKPDRRYERPLVRHWLAMNTLDKAVVTLPIDLSVPR